jgi:hypothetical protein
VSHRVTVSAPASAAGAVDLDDLLEVERPGLTDERADRDGRRRQQDQRRIGAGARVTAARHPEGGDLGLVEALCSEQLKQLALLGIGRREAGLDQLDAELVEGVRDAELFLCRKRHAFPLHAVTQRRVI